MKALKKVEVFEVQDRKCQSSIDISKYNRSPYLTNSEKEELTRVLNKKSTCLKKSYLILDRLLKPLHDCLDYIKVHQTDRSKTIRWIFREMEKRQTSFWAWSNKEWYEIFDNYKLLGYQTRTNRTPIMSIAYFLIEKFEYLPLKISCHKKLAERIFGKSLLQETLNLLHREYISLGYGTQLSEYHIPGTFCYILLANRSPYLKDITIDILNKCRANSDSEIVHRNIVKISRVLTNLEIINKPLKLKSEQGKNLDDTLDGIAPEWIEWCQKWLNTSTVKGRKNIYYKILKIGRWLAQNHPEIVTPEQWDRNVAIDFIAAVDKWTIGQWAGETKRKSNIYRYGEPLAPRGKAYNIYAIRQLIKDCQEWEWIPRKFSPIRALATPRSIRSLIKPKPRVIADEIWAKLLWAGLNLEQEDLLNSEYNKAHNIPYTYPLEMVQAIIVVWLFTGLRKDEIHRLRVGAVRWQKNDIIIPGTSEIIPKDPVCYLEIPPNKTSGSYTKPVDKAVGEAIEKWEGIRPKQPPLTDKKDGSVVNFLFLYRGRKLGKSYITNSIIPMLCQKAGIPNKDAIGRITSHRARSTIATQLSTAKDPMTLFELKEWLGHTNVASTINYAKVTPTKLAKSYQDAEYFKRNLRTVEVLIDQDVITTGLAKDGEPWKYYDLGHGLCTYDFFSQCKHRMACAGCGFYIPKGSSKAQIIEAKSNLERMLQEIPLTEDEQFAVTEGIEALTKLKTKLADVPTPSGQTPRQLEEEKNNA
ncbi:MAG: site-specific integrase [Prochloraceae cyanobacterium]|nr:site-specific integrase [Prochloraceae cyanobacterium]